MKYRTAIIISFCFFLFGCATSSSIAPYGKDTFILSVSDSWGTQNPGQLQVKAAQEAAEYCAKQGKSLGGVSSQSEGAQWWSGTSSNMIFKCRD